MTTALLDKLTLASSGSGEPTSVITLTSILSYHDDDDHGGESANPIDLSKTADDMVWLEATSADYSESVTDLVSSRSGLLSEVPSSESAEKPVADGSREDQAIDLVSPAVSPEKQEGMRSIPIRVDPDEDLQVEAAVVPLIQEEENEGILSLSSGDNPAEEEEEPIAVLQESKVEPLAALKLEVDQCGSTDDDLQADSSKEEEQQPLQQEQPMPQSQQRTPQPQQQQPLQQEHSISSLRLELAAMMSKSRAHLDLIREQKVTIDHLQHKVEDLEEKNHQLEEYCRHHHHHHHHPAAIQSTTIIPTTDASTTTSTAVYIRSNPQEEAVLF